MKVGRYVSKFSIRQDEFISVLNLNCLISFFNPNFIFSFARWSWFGLVALVTNCVFIFSRLTLVEKKNPATERMYQDSCGSIFVTNKLY